MGRGPPPSCRTRAGGRTRILAGAPVGRSLTAVGETLAAFPFRFGPPAVGVRAGTDLAALAVAPVSRRLDPVADDNGFAEFAFSLAGAPGSVYTAIASAMGARRGVGVMDDAGGTRFDADAPTVGDAAWRASFDDDAAAAPLPAAVPVIASAVALIGLAVARGRSRRAARGRRRRRHTFRGSGG